MSQKIGIFAGTFDPIHEGHIAFAQAVRQLAGLDRVIFLPEPSPRRKINVSPVNQRLAQIQSQIDTIDGLGVIHIDQAQFTVDQTLPALAKLYPQANFALLVGSDVVKRLHYWPHFESIRQTTKFIVGLRSGDSQSDITDYLDALGVKYDIVTTAHSDVSSTQKKVARHD